MTIEELKKQIESKTIGSEGIVFVGSDSFVAKQYINEIAIIHNREIEYMDSVDALKVAVSLFGKIDSGKIKVCIKDTIDKEVVLDEFCYLICKKYPGKDFVSVPKLENWQVIDYVRTNSSKSIADTDIEDLVKACKYDIHAVDIELSKYCNFDDNQQKSIFYRLLKNNQLPRLYDGDIFEFTTALINGDVKSLNKFYINLKEYDIEPLGVVTIIYRQLRNMILVGFNPNPTEQNTGLSSKQIYAIRKNLGGHSSQKLLNSFQVICEAEKLMKEGTISNNQLLDYVVVNML